MRMEPAGPDGECLHPSIVGEAWYRSVFESGVSPLSGDTW